MYYYIPSDTDETHVHDAGRAGEYIASHVDIAPHHSQRPVPYEQINKKICYNMKRSVFKMWFQAIWYSH